MLNVMLVDDNENILEGLSVLIDWEKYGYKVVAEASTGVTALEEVDKLEIDLVITDIRMPCMNGFELILKIKEKNPEIKFIFISGYNEFDYAKWAIDFQISGYLLKPIDEDELINILERVKKEIYERRFSLSTQQDFYMKHDVFGGSQNIEIFEKMYSSKKLRYCKIKPYDQEHIVSSSEKHDADNINILCKSLISFVCKNSVGCVINNHGGEIEFILNCELLDYNLKGYILDLAIELKKEYKSEFFIFIGQKVESISEIDFSKSSEKQIEYYAFYSNNQYIFIYEECTEEEFTEFLPNTSSIERLTEAIKHLYKKDVEEAVKYFFEEVNKYHIKVENVLLYINNIIFDVGSDISDNDISVVKYLYRCSLLKKDTYLHFNKVYDFLMENCLELWTIFQEMKNKNMLGVIAYIIDYVNDNYSDHNIKLQMFASKYYINSSYLGTIFRKKVGMSFNNYLTNTRIKKAKELLKNSNYKIYEIAEKVGFNDPNYFSVKFMNIEKVTPAKFREKMLNETTENN